RRHFTKGAGAYDRGEYEVALTEFLAARRLHTSAELEYDIARSYDRLGRWREAAAAYQRFLALAPTSPEAGTVRDRLATLHARIEEDVRLTRAVEPVTRRPVYKKGWFWGVVVTSAVVVGVGVGLGVAFGARRDPVA